MVPSIDVKIPLAGPKGSTKWISRRSSLTDDYTRTELRKLGLDYSSTQFQRWEAAGKLTPVKPSGSPASRVHYWGWNVKALIRTRLLVVHDLSRTAGKIPPEAALWGFFFSYLLSGVSGLIGTVIVLI